MEPEQRLYLNIIIQAIEDYALDTPVGANKEEGIHAKQEAIQWFKKNSQDYKEICEYAKVNSDKLRRKVLCATPSDLQRLLNEYRTLNRVSSLRNK